MRVDRWLRGCDDRSSCRGHPEMDETILSMEDHWPVEEELRQANKACDQIEEILDGLVQNTACSNQAIRDLLSSMSENWSDGEESMIWETPMRSQELEAC